MAAGFNAPSTPSEKHRRRVTNVYVGYGVPRAEATHTPRMPAPIGVEGALPPDEQPDVIVQPIEPTEDE